MLELTFNLNIITMSKIHHIITNFSFYCDSVFLSIDISDVNSAKKVHSLILFKSIGLGIHQHK